MIINLIRWTTGAASALAVMGAVSAHAGSPTAAGDGAENSIAPSARSAVSETTAQIAQANLQKVVFALPVKVPDEGQVWAYVSEGAGFFEEEGLKVDMTTNRGGGASLLQVASKNADFGLGNPEDVINAVHEGLDVRAVATVFTTQIYRFIALSEGKVKSYKDLRGGKIGISSLTSGSFPFAKFALAERGIDPETEVKFVQTGAGGPALNALKTGDVDALSIWDTQIARFRTLGTKITVLPKSTNVDFPGNLISVRTELLKSDPDLVARFSRAFIKGIVFAHANPEAAAKMYRELYPDAARGRDLATSVEVLKARLENLRLKDSQKGWGWIPIEEYEALQKAALGLGSIKGAVDLRKAMTNELASKIQDFDPEAVARSARQM